jgi:Fe2+ or Zn2+ uptake regulation protein
MTWYPWILQKMKGPPASPQYTKDTPQIGNQNVNEVYVMINAKVKTFLIPITRTCKACGKAFDISPDEQQKFAGKGLALPTNCVGCRQKKHRITLLFCSDCGRQFEFNDLEREFYERRGFATPKRCLACRRNRREYREYLNGILDPRD